MRKGLALVSVAILLVVSVPLAGAQMEHRALHVDLTPTMYAADAGLDGVTGSAHVQPEDGYLTITLQPNGAALPAGTVLEGWLVDAGLDGGMDMSASDMSGDDMGMTGETMTEGEDMGTPSADMGTPSEDMGMTEESGEDMSSTDDMGMTETPMSASNASAADEMYGAPFGDEMLNGLVSGAPYALSTGVLTPADDGTWTLSFLVPGGYNFTPYDAVVVTLESDADSMDGFDPRPGTPVFTGDIASSMAASEVVDVMGMGDMGMDMEMMGMGHDVILAPRDGAAMAGLDSLTGSATVYTDSGYVTVSVNLNGAEVPAGSILEAYLIDAGLDGGMGPSNASDADEAYGVAFGNADFKAAVEGAPYALSLGVLTPAEDGTLSLTFHIPAYNFSPYDTVQVTIESDGDDAMMGFDPRPGTPILDGDINGMM